MTITTPAAETTATSPSSPWPRIAGIAALVQAATFVVGIAMFATLLADYATGDPTPAESVAFVVDHQAAFHAWYVVIYIVFGVALVPLTLGLHHRLRDRAPALSQTATGFGLVWAGLVLGAGMIANVGVGVVADLASTDAAHAESVWASLEAVQDGLGGGNEVAGGVWVLLVSWAALRTGALPRRLAQLGVVSGAAGLVTVVPPLQDVGLIFGLGLIAWFAWVGFVLLREDR